MKIAHTLALASFAAALAFSGAAFAAGASSTTGTQGGIQDETGLTTLGVDISKVDLSKTDDFMASISADQQAGVKKGCETVVANQANQNATVLSFCQKLTGKM